MFFAPKIYPNGSVEVISKTDSFAFVPINRPWVYYFKNGLLLGSSLQEFESYLFGHLIIMANKIDLQLEFKHEEENYVVITIKKVLKRLLGIQIFQSPYIIYLFTIKNKHKIN